jgi:hypothetical protein
MKVTAETPRQRTFQQAVPAGRNTTRAESAKVIHNLLVKLQKQ